MRHPIAKKLSVTVAGFGLILIGLLLLVLPGPGLLTLAAGFALLATEYHWARRPLQAVKRRLARHPRQPDTKNRPGIT